VIIIKLHCIVFKVKYNSIILTLCIILSVLVLYISGKTLVLTYGVSTAAQRYNASVNTSLYEEGIDRIKPIEVTYTTIESSSSLNGISNADFVFEYIDYRGTPYYKAFFRDSVPKKTHPIVSIAETDGGELPKLNFIEDPKQIAKYKNKAKAVFVKLSYNISSNFVYENGLYYHYRDVRCDIDNAAHKPIAVSNLVVQFLPSDAKLESYDFLGNGSGLLFCGGKAIEIKWEKEKNTPVKIVGLDGNPISVVKGKTWWIITNDIYSVAYN
jgi:hypothetical protein